MAKTMQQLCDKARIPLNDADKARHSDPELLGFANDGIQILRSKRPDLFFGTFTTALTDKALGDSFPLDETVFPAVCDYVTARAESKNDESVLEQRATLFFSLFRGQIE